MLAWIYQIKFYVGIVRQNYKGNILHKCVKLNTHKQFDTLQHQIISLPCTKLNDGKCGKQERKWSHSNLVHAFYRQVQH